VAESTVFGARAGDLAAELAGRRGRRRPERAEVQASLARAAAPFRDGGPAPDGLSRRLKAAMWSGCGLVRSRAGLERTRTEVRELLGEAGGIGVGGGREWNAGWQQALDLVNQLQVAQVMVESALVREESRGAHFREDFRERRDDAWLRYVVARRSPDGEVETETRPVAFTRWAPEAAAVSAA
jgi:succinate dehydrogenase / fumarate reductase flavoprotein subunit/fumarate reductase flavoprotein subunit